ncbi:MAG: hypothetical protein Q7S43_04455 [bacterium]|nr:hypothetical protein [bacterium]
MLGKLGNHYARVHVFVTEETKKMSNDELLKTIKDIRRQWSDYELCFDVEDFERELKAEKTRRGL